jgi:glycosyltransferase involved in cell wall biosynthesis
MATGTPVVTNSKVLTSLAVTPGNELLVADSAEEFARSVLRLMEDATLQRNVGEAGLHYVRNHHSWKESARKMVEIYSGLPAFSGA